MLSVLRYRPFRRLFFAQIMSLLGAGLATVALSLMAYEISGSNAGAVIGMVLTLKMLIYVFVAPLSSLIPRGISPKVTLVAMDIIRTVVALSLPFVSQTWHVYFLLVIMHAASAVFSPIFQASVSATLPNENRYTEALSLSRLAYDLENLLSPSLAALFLIFVTWKGLYLGTSFGFIASAVLILSVGLNKSIKATKPPLRQLTQGFKRYYSEPAFIQLLSINAIVSLSGAMVLVNTVLIVQETFSLGETETAWALAAFGAGSMFGAVLVPKLLSVFTEQRVLFSAAVLALLGLFFATTMTNYLGLLSIWFCLGVSYGLLQPPIGRIVNRHSTKETRSMMFATQFSLSHACWFFAYFMAGWFGNVLGIRFTFGLFLLLTLAFIFVAFIPKGSVNVDRKL